jgi:glycosyltransferase involved in cell wall biosynthesis
VDKTNSTARGALPISAFVICQDEDGGLPIRLMHLAWRGYAGQKQFALSQASQPWCLSLDADEQLDEALQDSLPTLIGVDAGTDGWRLRRRPSRIGTFGPPPEVVFAKPILRLVRNGAHFDEAALVHEGLIVRGTVRTARIGLIRHDRQLAVADQLRKELGYARLKATERVMRGRRPSYLRLLVNPFLYFFRLFVLHRWFLCGHAGLVHAFYGAVYSFTAEAMHFELAARPTTATETASVVKSHSSS